MAGMKGNLVVPLTDPAGAPAGTARLQAAQYVPRLSFERGSAALDIEDPHPTRTLTRTLNLTLTLTLSLTARCHARAGGGRRRQLASLGWCGGRAAAV